jgi:hypothetical protein
LTEEQTDVTYLDLTAAYQAASSSDDSTSDSVASITRKTASGLTYMASKGGAIEKKPVTVWVVADVNNRQGREVVRAGAAHVVSGSVIQY